MNLKNDRYSNTAEAFEFSETLDSLETDDVEDNVTNDSTAGVSTNDTKTKKEGIQTGTQCLILKYYN